MAGGSLGVLSAKVALDTVDFNRNIAAMKRELKVAKSETELAGKGVVGFGKSTKVGAAQLEGLTKQINIQKQALDEYDSRYKTALKTQGEGSIQAQNAATNYNKTALEIQKLTSEHDLLSRTLQYNNSGYKTVSDSLINVGNGASKLGDGMMSAGKKWTVAGAALGAVAVVGAKSAIEYEDAFAGVVKTVDGTAQELDTLSDSVRNMATEIPVAATDLAGLAASAGQLGIELPNIEGFTRVIADLGVATNLAGEEGASTLAKFANITNMDQTQFSNLGSSIVELGNNFATTEADIANMAMRLGGAGTQVGMSQADILGLSAALSSVGIEAEAGGSAFSKVMIEMQLATEKGEGAFNDLKNTAELYGVSWDSIVVAQSKGGKSLKDVAGQMNLSSKELNNLYKEADKSAGALSNFADVAGMSSGEFSKLFKEDSVGAIGAFVEGLAKAEEQGSSAIKILDDMDITEVRLRDSLLRAANASGVFGSAVEMSNSAWEENVALTNEAETKYGTTASQIQIAKNKIKDLSITFGNELIPVVADVLEQSGPVIDWLKDMLEGFADSSPEAKKFAFSLGAIAIAGGPVLTLAGGLVKGIGGISKGIGTTVGLLGKAKFGLMGVETAMAGASASGGTLASVVGATGAISLGGALLVTTGVIAGTVLALQGLQEASEVYQRSGARWGTEVTEEQDKVIQKTHDLEVEAVASMDQYQAGVTEAAEEVKKAYQGIADEAEKSVARQNKANEKNIKKLPEFMQSDVENEIAANDKANQKILSGIQNRVDRVNEIMDNASANKRQLTENENTEIMRLTEGMKKEQLKIIGLNAKEQETILTNMSTNFSKMTPKMLEKYAADTEKALDKQQKLYKENQDFITTKFKDTPDKMNQMLNELSVDHSKTMDKMVSDYARAKIEAGTSIEDMATYLGQWGYTVEEARALIEKFGDETLTTSDKVSKGTEEADNAWNSMVLDPKTGEVRDNLPEFLRDLAKTDEGWEQLNFIAKEAELTTNARDEIAIAIGESGRWNELTVDEKDVVVNGDQAKLALFEAINEVEGWDKVEPLIKELGVHNLEAVTKLITSQELLETYESLTPEEKSLLIDASQGKEITITADKLESYKKIKDLAKHLQVTADTSGATEAQRAINKVPSSTDKYINVVYRGANTGQTAIHSNEKGTGFHPGGDMLVNDQKGSLYREAVKFPGSDWFIPEGRNVFIPGAERGTKVMPAGMTAAKFRNYAEGTGMDSSVFNAIPFKRPSNIDTTQQIVMQDNPALNSLVTMFSKFLDEFEMHPIIETVLKIDEREAVRALSPGLIKQQENMKIQNERIRGGKKW